MADAGGRAIEQVEAMVALERDCVVAGIRGQLRIAGSNHCNDCGDEIGKARCAAMPSARRCFDCEQAIETAKKRGW